ncbi:MAG: A/G-specific adenine glycosylase [Pirellulales bacterium]
MLSRNGRRPAATTLVPSSNWKQQLRRRVRAWYRRHARDLPWRRTCDPYAVWVSEVMLQQTQVETVRPYFKRFLSAFPGLSDLAAADEQQVMRHWEGLGYYRRARQLHQAAREVVERFGGIVPTDAATLRSLPGIGRYTAGAILSIAFDAREPILEANTVRLLSRLVGYRGAPASTEGQRVLWQLAEEILPRRDVGTFNQALMEIGSEVCKPQAPHCGECPLLPLCEAHRHQAVDQIPRPKQPPAIERVQEAAVAVRRNGRLLMLQVPEGERWAGLWDFIRVRLPSDDQAARDEQIIERVASLTGARVELAAHIATLKHGVTRFHITLHCHAADYVSGRLRPPQGGALKWFRVGELDDLPLSTTGRKFSRLLQSQDATTA